MQTDYDVIVIGGGPAGSTAGALAARYGHRVLILERETFPRFQIGESLMPGAYWTFKRLGVLERLNQTTFPRKYSVQFFSSSGKGAAPFYFHKHDPHESSITWQVLRSEFDQLLVDNAVESGAQVEQGAAVHQVLFEGERATGVQVRGSKPVRRWKPKPVSSSTPPVGAL